MSARSAGRLAINPRAMMALAGQQSGNSDEARYLNSLKPAFGERDVSIDLKIAKILPFINKVADEFKLVETVLMAAANTAAISSPVMPAGKCLPIKWGKTLSPS